MSLLHAFLLGIVQGLTEFLPVSSSGHLVLIPALLGWEPHPEAFDAALHLGTLLAVFVALRTDIVALARGLVFGGPYRRIAWYVMLGSVPVLGVGFVMQEVLNVRFDAPWMIALSLAVWGVLLFVADRHVGPRAETALTNMTWQQAAWIAFGQMFALVPGTSRSGATITSGLFVGLDRVTAARFSFLLGIPAIAAAGSFSVLQIVTGDVSVDVLPLVVGMLASFLSGALVIRWLLTLVSKANFFPFAVYRVALALITLLVLGW